jgi:hypothetical protein
MKSFDQVLAERNAKRGSLGGGRDTLDTDRKHPLGTARSEGRPTIAPSESPLKLPKNGRLIQDTGGRSKTIKEIAQEMGVVAMDKPAIENPPTAEELAKENTDLRRRLGKYEKV